MDTQDEAARAAGGVASAPVLDAEQRAKLGAMRGRLQSVFAQIVLALIALPRYRHQSLADLTHLVVDPLVRDRFALATAKGGESDGATAGIALWASVSAEIDATIREQIKAGVFPVRLKAGDWNSGDIVWLLDVIAPSQKLATAVLANFQQVSGKRSIHIHPIVAKSVDPEALKQLSAKTSESPASAGKKAT